MCPEPSPNLSRNITVDGSSLDAPLKIAIVAAEATPHAKAGGLADVIAVDLDHAWVVDGDVSMDQASMGEPVACVAHSMRRGGFLAGDSFTVADINVMPILAYLRNFPESGAAIASAKSLSAYYDRLASRPSFLNTVPPPPPVAYCS